MKRQPEERTLIDIDGRDVPLRLRWNGRARNMTLRIELRTGGAVVTLPAGVPASEGKAMARRKAAWLKSRLDGLPENIPFGDGASVPLLGRERTIRHVGGYRGRVMAHDDAIHVPGRIEHLPRRLRDWLRAEAKRELSTRVVRHAGVLGVRPGRVTVRDTRSRWGSCAPNGNLSFSWRLVLAPEDVMDYVVAHEVAHLVAMNHGPRFWAVVKGLVPDVEGPRRWLREHGARLHRYGSM
ncbi:MAG: M48 family metallopeptidase [Rhodospirillales bacterium]|nr:M48 family metallopeptidase [Rhodospirillales bacterium]